MFFTKSGGARRRIDYVLVYGRDSVDDHRRKEFEEELTESGIQLEYEDIEVTVGALQMDADWVNPCAGMRLNSTGAVSFRNFVVENVTNTLRGCRACRTCCEDVTMNCCRRI